MARTTLRSPARFTGLNLRRMSRAAKVKLAAEMTSAVARITMDSIRYRHPGISKKKLLDLTRGRLRRHQPVSIEEVLAHLLEARKMKHNDLAGKHIAIIGDTVVASGKTPIEVWKKAKKLHPDNEPVLTFVSKDDILSHGSKGKMKLSDFAGAWNVTDREMRESYRKCGKKGEGSGWLEPESCS